MERITLSNSLATDFIDNRLSQVHPLMSAVDPKSRPGCGTSMSEKLAIPFSTPETEEMRQQQVIFETTITEFEKWKVTRKVGGFRLTDKQKWRWEDVFQELDTANQRYQEVKKDGIFGGFRSCLRNFAKLKEPVEHWLTLFPSESWQGSLVCGGLKLVLNAAWRLGEIREEVGSALEQIPLTVDKVQKLLKIYVDAQIREEHVSQLFVVILEILGLCLKWFMKSSTRKLIGTTIKGETYYGDLRVKIEILKRLESRIDDQSMVGLHARVGKSVDIGTAVLEKIEQLCRGQERDEIIARMAAELKREERELQEIRERSRVEQLQLAGNRRDFLLDRLNHDERHTLKDLKESLAAGPTLSLHVQDRATWVLRAEQLIRWLTDSNSNVLVVNGNEAQHELESGVSFFSAMLLSVLRDTATNSHGCVRLQWFCGRNTDSDIHRMTYELLGQLLQSVTLSIPTLNEDWQNGVRLGDFRTIVKFLCVCIREQLRHCPVFIVIDTISEYEGRDRFKDLRYLYKKLSSLVDDLEDVFPLKVLITSPIQSSRFGTCDDIWRPELLEVPDVVDGDLSGINEDALVAQMAEETHVVGEV